MARFPLAGAEFATVTDPALTCFFTTYRLGLFGSTSIGQAGAVHVSSRLAYAMDKDLQLKGNLFHVWVQLWDP